MYLLVFWSYQEVTESSANNSEQNSSIPPKSASTFPYRDTRVRAGKYVAGGLKGTTTKTKSHAQYHTWSRPTILKKTHSILTLHVITPVQVPFPSLSLM